MPNNSELRALLSEASDSIYDLGHRGRYKNCAHCNLNDRTTAALSEKDEGGWIKCIDRLPETDGFYWCITECPPQSHPQQAIRFRGGHWLTSWPVINWQPLPPLPERKV